MTDLANKLNELHSLVNRLTLQHTGNKAVSVPLMEWSRLFDLVTEAADLAEKRREGSQADGHGSANDGDRMQFCSVGGVTMTDKLPRTLQLTVNRIELEHTYNLDGSIDHVTPMAHATVRRDGAMLAFSFPLETMQAWEYHDLHNLAEAAWRSLTELKP